MLKNIRLAAILLWREWRSGAWLIVFLSLFLAVAAITTMHFYIDRLKRGLEHQSSMMLGDDLVISSSTPMPIEWQKKAAALGLVTAEIWAYPTMVSTKHRLQLINLQAVSKNFPLMSDQPKRPGPHQVWLDRRALPLLGLHREDPIQIGVAAFTISDTLTSSLETLNSWSIAPSAVIRLEDVAATKTVLPGSRVDYRLLLRGEAKDIQMFRQWLKPQVTPNQHLIDIHSQQNGLQHVLERAEHYLQLVLIICIMMSGIAIMTSTREYLRNHYRHVALWRCLGMREKSISQIYFWQLITIALSAGILGVATGYLAQFFIAHLLEDILSLPLPLPSYAPVLLGLGASTLTVFAFAYPILIELPKISPLILWREETQSTTARGKFYFGIIAALLFLLIYWLAGISLLILFMITALILSIGFLYALIMIFLRMLGHIAHQTEGVVRRGLSELIQHPDSVSTQFIGFTLIITLLLVLNSVRSDLLADWQKSLPKNTPNYFAINIAPEDLPGIKKIFTKFAVPIDDLYPMVRGRLVQINNQPIMTAVPKTALNNNALHRELNLSWMLQYPSDNKVVTGTSWSQNDAGKPLISVEEQLAADLKLHLNDQLTFQIGDQEVSAKIINIRSLEWTSFHPNFYVIFAPGILEAFPTTYISSFYLPPQHTQLLNVLIQKFPNITIIDIAAILAAMQQLITTVAQVIQYLFIFALGIGVLIFIASLQSSLTERRATYRLLSILGASKKYIMRSIVVEFSCLGFLIIGTSLALSEFIATALIKSAF